MTVCISLKHECFCLGLEASSWDGGRSTDWLRQIMKLCVLTSDAEFVSACRHLCVSVFLSSCPAIPQILAAMYPLTSFAPVWLSGSAFRLALASCRVYDIAAAWLSQVRCVYQRHAHGLKPSRVCVFRWQRLLLRTALTCHQNRLWPPSRSRDSELPHCVCVSGDV